MVLGAHEHMWQRRLPPCSSFGTTLGRGAGASCAGPLDYCDTYRASSHFERQAVRACIRLTEPRLVDSLDAGKYSSANAWSGIADLLLAKGRSSKRTDVLKISSQGGDMDGSCQVRGDSMTPKFQHHIPCRLTTDGLHLGPLSHGDRRSPIRLGCRFRLCHIPPDHPG